MRPERRVRASPADSRAKQQDARGRGEPACELCLQAEALMENELAYVRLESNSLSEGHVVVVPKRHVANFFDMRVEEQSAVLALLRDVQVLLERQHAPDGYNIGVNVGKAGGQARMHVHVHLIPRYAGDVPDPRGGIRCVLGSKALAT